MSTARQTPNPQKNKRSKEKVEIKRLKGTLNRYNLDLKESQKVIDGLGEEIYYLHKDVNALNRTIFNLEQQLTKSKLKWWQKGK